MMTQLKIIMLAPFILIGAGIFSCSKQQGPAKEMVAKVSQNPGKELAKIMAADQLVRDYFMEDKKFTDEYEAWFNGLTVDTRNRYVEQMQATLKAGKRPANPTRTVDEVNQYRKLQADRITQIERKYPVFAKRSDDQHPDLLGQIDGLILGANKAQPASGCSRGYRACTGTYGSESKSNDACYAGYIVCVAATQAQ